MWRPDGWDVLDIYAAQESIATTGTDLIEAGADAYEEALKRTGFHIRSDERIALQWRITHPDGTKEWVDKSYYESGVPCTLVFIPDEKSNGKTT